MCPQLQWGPSNRYRKLPYQDKDGDNFDLLILKSAIPVARGVIEVLTEVWGTKSHFNFTWKIKSIWHWYSVIPGFDFTVSKWTLWARFLVRILEVHGSNLWRDITILIEDFSNLSLYFKSRHCGLLPDFHQFIIGCHLTIRRNIVCVTDSVVM
jgi:hypothetical protein